MVTTKTIGLLFIKLIFDKLKQQSSVWGIGAHSWKIAIFYAEYFSTLIFVKKRPQMSPKVTQMATKWHPNGNFQPILGVILLY